MAEQDPAEQAVEQGYIGEVHDEIENDAYTVSGQGEETARREREQRRALRTKFEDASVDAGDSESTSSRKSSKSSKTTSSGSSSSSSESS